MSSKTVLETLEAAKFYGTKDFEALYAAEMWCRENGYSFGTLQADAPTGIVKGLALISKWRNLSASDLAALDGYMDSPGRCYRNGPVTIHLYAAKEREAQHVL